MSADKKLVRSKSGLRIISSNYNHRSPFELFEPPWVEDKECSQCTQCKGRFDFIKRRHHCRRCGHIFCKSCCDTKLPLPRMCFLDPVRICSECTEVTRKENDFYDKHLKILTCGANFVLSSTGDDGTSENPTFFCKLSSDHRFIVFDGGNLSTHDPVNITGVQSTEIVKSDSDIQGNSYATELKIVYINEQKTNLTVYFTAAAVPNKKLSIAWIIALLKAIKLMNESQNTTAT